MTKNTVLVLDYKQAEYTKKLNDLNLDGIEIISPENDEEIAQNIAAANIILGNPEIVKNWINQATNLTWMQSTFAGIDSMNSSDLRKDYLLTNVKDVFGKVMAEYVLGYVLLFEKEVLENLDHQEHKQWERRTTTDLSSKTLGILGAGSIGKDVAFLAKAAGMKVVGYKHSQGEVENFDEIVTGEQLPELLTQSDYVVNILPNTEATNDIMDAAAFTAMKPTATFMNLGRGNAVDEDALVAALKAGEIQRAVLDVFKTEPLPEDSELWTTKGVYVTPHMSGNIVSDALMDIFSENYRRFQAQEELMNLVDLEKGY